MVRRLAAILASDTVGYSRLMGLDEEAPLFAFSRSDRPLAVVVESFPAGRVSARVSLPGSMIRFHIALSFRACYSGHVGNGNKRGGTLHSGYP